MKTQWVAFDQRNNARVALGVFSDEATAREALQTVWREGEGVVGVAGEVMAVPVFASLATWQKYVEGQAKNQSDEEAPNE